MSSLDEERSVDRPRLPARWEEHRFVVPSDAAGTRLDLFVASALGTSRRQSAGAIEDGRVWVEGRPGRKGEAVDAGQVVIARVPSGDRSPVPQPELPLRLWLRDPSFLVVEKESGLPTHPLEPGETGCAANAWMARFPECATAGLDPREAGAVHRLDTPTSGLLVVARNRSAWEALRRQFADREPERAYLALVAGDFGEDRWIDRPLERSPGAPGQMRPARDPEAGRPARTRVEVERRLGAGAFTLLRCHLDTGVMHQIRVHLASEGFPIAGDARYGGPKLPGLDRLFLHATALRFSHPTTGEEVRVESPLPDELHALLSRLEG